MVPPPTSERRPRRALPVVAALALAMLSLTPLWSTLDGRDGWSAVYFEPGAPAPRLGPPLDESMVPHPFVDRGGALQVPQGRALALPLSAPHRVTQRGGGLPLVALGRRSDPGLEELWTPTRDGGGPLEADRPLREELPRLDALGASCGAADGLEIDPGPPATLRFGACRWSHDGADTLLVLGADRWKSVQRLDGGFARRRRLRAPLIGVSAALAALLALGLGWGIGGEAALGTGATAALLSAASAPLGVLFTTVAAALGLLAAAARAGRRVLAVLAAALLLIGASGAVLEGSGAVLAGYSTVEGDGLRPDGFDPGGLLQQNCPDLAGVERVAHAGGTIDWLQARLCGADGPRGRTVILLGGTNDDLIWGLRGGGAGGRLAFLMAGLRATVAPSTWTPEGVDAFYEAAAARSAAAFAGQESLYGDAVGCVSRDGGRFLLAQNFLITDLRRGRGEPRSTMVRSRIGAVQRAGGQGFDLLERVGDRAALSWFADYIHLSAVGHTAVDRAICQELASESGG